MLTRLKLMLPSVNNFTWLTAFAVIALPTRITHVTCHALLQEPAAVRHPEGLASLETGRVARVRGGRPFARRQLRGRGRASDAARPAEDAGWGRRDDAHQPPDAQRYRGRTPGTVPGTSGPRRRGFRQQNRLAGRRLSDGLLVARTFRAQEPRRECVRRVAKR